MHVIAIDSARADQSAFFDRTMVTNSRRLFALFTFALVPVLAACPGSYEGGYEKVMYQERTTLARADAPNPPPLMPIAGGAGAGAPTLAADIMPAGVTQEMVEEGQRLYGTVCAACHGAGGSGSAAGPALQDQNWLHIGGSYDEIVAIIQAGVPTPIEFPAMMPPLGGGSFDDAQVRAIAAYVFALSHQS